jgi:hypothetical protein
LHTDAENVFGGGVEVDDQQAVINEDDAGAQAVENSFGVVGRRSVITGTPATDYLTVFCCT